MNILIINGPNLNLLGKREPGVYGSKSFEEYYNELIERYPKVNLSYFQSNSEGKIIDQIHESGYKVDGIVLNAGAYTHTSLAIADSISAISSAVIEVHISNVFAREAVRHHSYISQVCIGSISGFGLTSYDLAIEAILRKQ